jgi:hypothetical protein
MEWNGIESLSQSTVREGSKHVISNLGELGSRSFPHNSGNDFSPGEQFYFNLLRDFHSEEPW